MLHLDMSDKLCRVPCMPMPASSASRRIAWAEERASSKRAWSQKRTLGGRCPRLLEQRPNRGVLSSCRESTGWTPPTSNSDGARRWLPIRGPWQL